MLQNIDPRTRGRREVQVVTTVPTVQETLTVVRPANREVRVTDVGKPPADWSWEDLRNYVVRQIETFYGDFPKDATRLKAIFYSFHQRHGADAGRIAIAAFETYRGVWKGAPISVTRFCKASDQYFAAPILERLNAPS